MTYTIPEPVHILGIPVHPVSLPEAVRAVEGLVCTGEFSLVVTPNPELIMRAQADACFARVLKAADLAVADGIGVVWASRVLGVPVPERVSGIDLMTALLARAAELKLEVFFLGTRPDTIERAAQRARSRFTGLRLVGYHHGYFDETEEQAVVEAINEASPQLLFVGMGVPREQEFLQRWKSELGDVAAMGVGGSFDVLAGDKQRAPEWVQTLNIEWLYRLVREPARLGRQASTLPTFVLRILAASVAREGDAR